MKMSMIAATLIISFFSVSKQTYAETYDFSCGKVGNVTRSIIASSKEPGVDGYALAATYQTGGVDATTGIQTKKVYQLVGQSDILENSGKQTSALTFLQWSNPNFQVVVTKTKKKGAIVDGAEINAQTGKGIEFKCKLNSYAK